MGPGLHGRKISDILDIKEGYNWRLSHDIFLEFGDLVGCKSHAPLLLKGCHLLKIFIKSDDTVADLVLTS